MARPSTEVISRDSLVAVRKAASDRSPITGLTHCFYRYPARFSPQFVSSAIEAFSKPGDIVLDPYMGGGTTMVEAMVRGRRPIGCDLNSLAVFVARAKTMSLDAAEEDTVRHWANIIVPRLSYHEVTSEVSDLICPDRTRNLNLPRARPAKKLFAQCILTLQTFESERAKGFARCVLLNAAQWALNNRRRAPSLEELREKIRLTTKQMLGGLTEVSERLREQFFSPVLIHGSSETLSDHEPFAGGLKANLVVTSPPYPGIHILYHRWQVDGRKETPAPYWIASCMDGKGSSFYNFADRRNDNAEDDYFSESLRTLKAIRSVTNEGALVVQMIAFAKPRTQLPRYLENMRRAGFSEMREVESQNKARRFRRIWRRVPGRVWYASLKGRTSSSREVVLIHRAA